VEGAAENAENSGCSEMYCVGTLACNVRGRGMGILFASVGGTVCRRERTGVDGAAAGDSVYSGDCGLPHSGKTHSEGEITMRILVVSDSHGRRTTLEDVVTVCAGANAPDMVIHLGDNISDARYLRERVRQPVMAVPGNCDWSDEEAERVENVGGAEILFCHGHTRHVKTSLMSLACLAQEKGVKAALFGHTHAPYMAYEYGILLLNPGALKDERCAMMEIKNGEVQARLLNIDKLC